MANFQKLDANAGRLAEALDAFVRMYETHAAREDTIVFPAWKDAISNNESKELSEKFEEIEHKTFGKDGFDAAVRQIAEIDGSLKMTDISQFTAPGSARVAIVNVKAGRGDRQGGGVADEPAGLRSQAHQTLDGDTTKEE